MTHAHRLDCEATTVDCRFIVQSADVEEAVAVAKAHLRDVHGRDVDEDELRSDHLRIV